MSIRLETALRVDEQRMGEAIALARSSLVRVSPNPRVGCVLYHASGQRIASGVTEPPGGRHAEIVALEDARAQGVSLAETTAYVTLEPCAHHGRTAPCVDALIQSGIARVCVGVIDPNPLVGGRGIQRLRDAGVIVEIGLLAESCEQLHSPFFKWIHRGQPWVSLKGAMTLDGCLSTASGQSQWITGIEARTHVHQLRAQVDAMMVGGETMRRDRPSLTVRHSEGTDPLPVAVSRRLSIPNDSPILQRSAILIHGPDAPEHRREAFSKMGATLVEVPYLEGHQGQSLDLNASLKALGALEITHLCVEGGGALHGSFLTAGLIDDLYLYIAPKLIGRGKPLFNFPSVAHMSEGWLLEGVQTTQLGSDLHIYGRFVHHQADTVEG